jgi:NAD(P)-dependent dehydrogenase (short-subunit alcohol dehydrogenase family)
MFDLNATSVVNTARAVVPAMIAAGAGNIVNVAAAASVRGQANMAAYAVAKNAVVRLTESMAAELRGHGIAVCCVMPTVIDTPQNRTAMPGADISQWPTRDPCRNSPVSRVGFGDACQRQRNPDRGARAGSRLDRA